MGNPEQWTFELRASEHEGLTQFQTYCREHNIPIEVTELHTVSPLNADQEYDLTNGQKKVLVVAYSRGYFDSPRGATQDDLADELGITRQAVSSRLQRGIRRLVASTLIIPDT